MNKINKGNLEVIKEYEKHRFSLGKADNTVKTDINAIRKLSIHIGNKAFKDVNESDLKDFFIDIKNFVMRDHYASRIICFYKWFFRLDNDKRPKIMEWYRYSNRSEREKQKDPYIKASLIEPEEYSKIIQKVRMDLRMSALYETLYLSGARPDEICNMKIENVINDKGKISIIVENSKSIPREIPLTEKPSLLLRWLNNHPNKDNNKDWLFTSFDRRFKNRHIEAKSVSSKFKKLVKELRLKPTLILYSFRKTRATIMFNQGFDDKEMGLLFGWRPHTVIERRNEYDLRGLDDLKNKIFKKVEIYKTREELIEENIKIEQLEEKYEKEIKELKEENNKIIETLEFIIKMKEKEINILYKQEEKQFEFEKKEMYNLLEKLKND